MKCPNCRAEMTSTRENHRYDANGLNVTLVGIDVGNCPKCGEKAVRIPAIDKLNKAIARAVILKPGRLTGAEFRFLRKSLGWSGADTAANLKADVSSVSRWENGKQEIGIQTDLLMRMYAAVGTPLEAYPAADLHKEFAAVADDSAKPVRVDARYDAGRWDAHAA